MKIRCSVLFLSFFLTFFMSSIGNSVPMPLGWTLFTGKIATEGTLEFQHWTDFRFEIPRPLTESSELLLKLAAKSAIEKQLKYMFGPLYALKERQSAPKLNHDIEIVQLFETKDSLGSDLERAKNVFRVVYHYRGKLVIKNSKEREFTIKIPLPTRPDKIFEKSIVYEGPQKKATYPCFSPDALPIDYDENYFWYFWDPDLQGCPLEEGKDYVRTTGLIQLKPNTENTYPQYPDLVHNGKISVSVFVGMDDSTNSRDPRASQDDAASSFRIYLDWLNRNGFKKVLTKKALYWPFIEKDADKPSWEKLLARMRFLILHPYTIEEYSKKLNGIQYWVRLVFGPTGMTEDSEIFWQLFRDSIENHSMMIYDGHSGLGVDLSISGLNIRGNYNLKPDPTRYQIYHFDACDSYAYYNNKYFVLKGGTRKLDIVTNGLITDMDFEGREGEMKKYALLQAVLDWVQGTRVWSYQDLMNIMDSDNLLGVNGDEDNPTTPPPFPY